MMLMLRKHQTQFSEVIDGIINGSGVRDILLAVTPGGGKSSIPIIAGRLKEADLIDGLAWVVPRQALQDQGERGFLDPFFRRMFNHGLTIRSATNDKNPCRGTDGFVTTYQALGMDEGGTVLNEFRCRRYALILDEFHHVEEGGIWHQALDPIYRNAEFVVKMTGTLERGDGKPIAFIRYRGGHPVLENDDHTAVITYNRRDALAEKAILPISFYLNDGQSSWVNQNGESRKIDSFSQAKKTERAAALYTALKTDFASELLRECVLHWRALIRENPRAKMLVVTAEFDQAKDVTYMLKRSIGLNAEIATSHNSKDAARAIKHFKAGKVDVLVTIAMAYEGLDVPPVTHICCLTHIRSTPWIEQMVARGVRIDKGAGPYEFQRCHVFAPKDDLFVEIMDRIRKEQTPRLKKGSKPEESEFEKAQIPGDGSGTIGPDITPLGSSLTDRSEHFIGLDGVIIQEQAELPLMDTVSERETKLRQKIAKHINSYSYIHRYKPQRINAEIKRHFGKARDDMGLEDLELLLQHIEKYYPCEIVDTLTEPPPGMEEYLRPRARRKRVSSKPQHWTPRSEIMKFGCYDGIRGRYV
ncbi:DEAD/DEAH box helicase [Desulfospira joergensenii]|uniref:DEAD/DEAH box helicase n=1 Tax=Desulfospira joergensenii TaxID=53329 RepID=UPI0003B3F098|nr:helicase-related protein [Desulfospira joergensenii]